ncbi:beta galactosidase jelly roll domain-containing protein [Mucilaginibacter sp. Bleaf8]|uniref:glycoside hydrolase family 2 protein n=1 Tax=Mucilaginibacter sp. Bleaf8 TaxID=2834430 RepID=UPI001BCF6058|nr:sugar-binding domain-containing protein [Mucilaginibacter sp. Bleaf8]MBS7566645.1 beta galactosidase jelly roll domain-containing protein [Mucilaginibacter sp. Bleaf8]
MRKLLSSAALVALSVVGMPAALKAQTAAVKQVQLTRFQLQSSAIVKESGKELSGNTYHGTAKWYPVRVPSTVLTGLVANKVYPDPYQALNNMRIPDASDEFNKQYDLDKYSHLPGKVNPWKKPYWYRTTFNVPAGDKGKTFQLIFKGINYRAEVWLNGKRIADSTQMAGMFADYNLQVSKQIVPGGVNTLAVKIFPLDYPGLPDKEQLEAMGPFYLNGGPTGDIGKNVTMLCSVGWDWMPPVRDRNMGIWQPVFLRTTGGVTISRPKLATELALPDTSTASVKLNLILANHSAAAANGKLTVSIKPENFAGSAVQFTRNVSVKAGEAKDVNLTPAQVSELYLRNPKLWWPNGYGKANLYRIRLQYASGKQVMDDTTFVFGVRTVSTKATDVNGFTRREFFVNGKRVHLNGGAWVPDMMVNRDSARYDYELHLCRNANVNLVRIWGGGVTPPDHFWNACDKYGLMVWSDFWITGDTQGEFKGSPDYPLEGNIFTKNVIRTIYRIRNHPSLLVWTGGNEGHARKELYDAMRNNVIQLDGTRPFIPSSSGFAKLPAGWQGSWPDNLPSGVYSGGPYAWKDPKEYYKLADAGKDWVFKDETGIPSQPPYNTLAKNIPDTTWDQKLPYPLNNMWGYHDAATGAGKYDEYYKDMVDRYGKPKSRVDFSNKMQLMNAAGYQAIFESAGHKLTETGGVMLWKLNAAFPSVIWQIYDWYLQPNAGFYAMQNAVEPIHIQFNQNDSTVAVLNRTHAPTGTLMLQADVYNTKGKQLFHQMATANLSDEGVKEVIPMAYVLKPLKELSLVVLNIKDTKGKVISRNAYWMAPGNDYTSLSSMPNAQLQTTLVKTEKGKTENKWTLQITNKSSQVAFFVRPQLLVNNDEIRPSYWSASYITLAPNESATVSVSAPVAKLTGGAPTITVEGWNVRKQSVTLSGK